MLTEVASQESVQVGTNIRRGVSVSPDDPKVLCTTLGQASYSSSNPAQTSCCSTATVHAWLGGLALPIEPYGDD